MGILGWKVEDQDREESHIASQVRFYSRRGGTGHAQVGEKKRIAGKEEGINRETAFRRLL
jgi:hypothetical protein